MLQNNLINHCICGNETDFAFENRHGIAVVKCNQCGIVHQQLAGWDEERYFNFYKEEYHDHYMKIKGVDTYQSRYEHDCNVARLRLSQYGPFYISAPSSGLDIGSSNSAFVHEANKLGFNVKGLEPGTDIGDDAVTIRGTLDTINLDQLEFDWITMHDSVEHMIDVGRALSQVYKILKDGGILILDLPNFFVKEGLHHWKYIEHLWFFSRDQMTDILNKQGFTVIRTDVPIAGKLVFYCRK
jgi:SAM-dependent methyltransferase